MKILHVNTYDVGGAANACLRIHKSLLKKGIDSKVLFYQKGSSFAESETYKFNYWDGTFNQFHTIKKAIEYFLFDRKQRRRQLPYSIMEKFSFPTTIFDITQNPFYQKADIVQLNWVADFLDEKSFFEKNKKPVLWRMADLYTCGGGNHYEKGFDPKVYETLINENLRIRKEALEKAKDNLHFVPISHWVKQKADESSLIKSFPKTLIHCGVNVNIFKPVSQDVARRALGLPLNKKIIGFGAQSLTNPRKGMNYLKEFVDKAKNQKLFFASFGANELHTENNNVYNLGAINDELLLSLYYSAIDVFVMPAIEEAFGQVIIESLACGTPVVSFRTGGGMDTIQTDKNGVLASEISGESLSESIMKAVDTDYDKDWIVQDAVTRFDIDKKAEEYIRLYEKILKNK